MRRGGFRWVKSRRMPWPAHGAGPRRRWALLLMLGGMVVLQAALIGGRAPRLTLANAPNSPQVYGVDDARMQAAVNAAGWPQQVFNWCGVATVAAIADYRGGGVSQAGVAGWMQSGAAVSQWGTPSFIYPGPAFRADIARDSGTDPRSLAAGLAAMAGGRYHALADPWGSWDATYRLAADIEYSGQPISVIVDHGLHSVVVSKVFANGDPAANPSSIFALEVWDPGYGSAFNAQIQSAQHVVVPLGDWLYDEVYWGAPYYQNGNWDPDPAVGPYTYDPSAGDYNTTWIGNWVYIQPWGPAVSVDWTVNALDWVVPGQHGELPPGYALPTPTPLPGRDGRAAPFALAPSPTAPRRSVAVPPTTAAGTAPTPYGGAPPEALGPPLAAPSVGLTWCLGPYCLAAIDPLWLATSGGLVALALLLLVSALWARRLARRRATTGPAPARAPRAIRAARKPGTALGSVTVTEVAAVPHAPSPPMLDAAAPRVVPVLDPSGAATAPLSLVDMRAPAPTAPNALDATAAAAAAEATAVSAV